MFRFRIIIISIFMALALAIGAQAAEKKPVSPLPETKVPTGPPSRAMFPEKKFDFGMVKPDQTVSHDFMVKNEGPGDLIIQKVSPG